LTQKEAASLLCRKLLFLKA